MSVPSAPLPIIDDSHRQRANPLGMFRDLGGRFELIKNLTQHELRTQFRASFLGAIWMAAQPLLSLAVYSVVFIFIFRPRVATELSPPQFVLQLFCGITIYWVFAHTVARAPMLIVSKPNLVKSVVFPLQVLPLATLGVSLTYFLFSLGILTIAILIVQGTLHVTMLLLPVVLLPLLMLTLGLSWFLSSLGVYVRDTQPGVQFLVQMFFFLTPIVWTFNDLPEGLRRWLMLNPLATIIESARAVMLHGFMPDWIALGIVAAVAAIVMMMGYAWFMRTREGFSDVL